MEEIKIGEVFQVGRIKFKCVEGKNCVDCVFYKYGGLICSFLSKQGIECEDRKDLKKAIFIEVEE